jgi:putative Holliday junction resolvase
MRVLGVDFGRSRTGLALSDPLKVTCSPLTVVEEKDEDRLVERIVSTALQEDVSEIVVGFPRPLAGGTNAQCDAVMAFKARLQDATRIHVRLWDERFTSKLAGRGRTHKGAEDAVAACYILQSYLDSRAEHMEDS